MAKTSLPMQLYTERDGRELAVSMLRELECGRADLFAIEAEWRPEGVPQINIVRRYLETLRKSNSEALEAGFGAILTDYIGSAGEGSGPGADLYDELIDGNARLLG